MKFDYKFFSNRCIDKILRCPYIFQSWSLYFISANIGSTFSKSPIKYISLRRTALLSSTSTFEKYIICSWKLQLVRMAKVYSGVQKNEGGCWLKLYSPLELQLYNENFPSPDYGHEGLTWFDSFQSKVSDFYFFSVIGCEPPPCVFPRVNFIRVTSLT